MDQTSQKLFLKICDGGAFQKKGECREEDGDASTAPLRHVVHVRGRVGQARALLRPPVEEKPPDGVHGAKSLRGPEGQPLRSQSRSKAETIAIG